MEFNQIIKDLKNKVYSPVYLLAGEEEFFIDQISDYIEDHVLDAGEKEFNQTILYGLDTDVLTVESEAKRYPMMAPYNVVIVKEAQNLKKMEGLANYAAQPSPTSILVLCHKHKKADGRSKFVKEVKKSGVFFQSNRLYDNQVGPWMDAYVKKSGFSILPKASALLLEFLGTDLSKISNELDKLMLSQSKELPIDDKAIEENIGISKDYNVFELNNAFGKKDILRANRIINYFGQNEKGHPLPMVIPAIYRYFSQLLLYHAVKSKPSKEIASAMGINPYFLKEYQEAAQYYSVKKIARIISALRRADMNSKGVDANLNAHDVLKELIFEILH